jgi:DNA-directed RNA polymerase specialized sigma subunit
MSNKVITIKLPPWLSEDEAEKVISEVIARLGGRVSVEEVRKKLGIKPEELVEDLKTDDYSVEELRRRERKRLP